MSNYAPLKNELACLLIAPSQRKSVCLLIVPRSPQKIGLALNCPPPFPEKKMVLGAATGHKHVYPCRHFLLACTFDYQYTRNLPENQFRLPLNLPGFFTSHTYTLIGWLRPCTLGCNSSNTTRRVFAISLHIY